MATTAMDITAMAIMATDTTAGITIMLRRFVPTGITDTIRLPARPMDITLRHGFTMECFSAPGRGGATAGAGITAGMAAPDGVMAADGVTTAAGTGAAGATAGTAIADGTMPAIGAAITPGM